MSGLIFTGDVLQVSGEAHIIWGDARYGGTATGNKHVRVKVLAVVGAKGANPLRMKVKELSPFSPPLPPGMMATMADEDHRNSEKAETNLNQLVVRCKEVIGVAEGVKSFRFEAATCCGGRDLPAWTPGQVGRREERDRGEGGRKEGRWEVLVFCVLHLLDPWEGGGGAQVFMT